MSKIWKPVRHLFLNSVLNKTSQTLTYIYIHSKPDRVYKKRIPTYQSTSVIYKSGKKYAIARIQELFKLSRTEAVEIAERYKKLCKTPSNAIVNNYELLKNFEIPDGVILKYMDVLALTNLQGKVEALKKLPFPLTDTLPLLQMHNNRLTHFIKENQHESNVTRIKRLCELLEISVSELSEVFVKRSFLCKINLDKVEKNLKTLLEYGIKLEQIRNDYWVLQYKHDVITERLQFANQQNIDTIKTWMVRAQPKILNRYYKRRSDNKLILGNATLVEYLSERLECPLHIIQQILLRHPALLHKQLKKTKEIIDFLYAYGFTPLHIVRNPKILLHSIETTANRLKELQSQGLKVDSLYVLTKSQKQYLSYYDNLVKVNKSKIKEG